MTTEAARTAAGHRIQEQIEACNLMEARVQGAMVDACLSGRGIMDIRLLGLRFVQFVSVALLLVGALGFLGIVIYGIVLLIERVPLWLAAAAGLMMLTGHCLNEWLKRLLMRKCQQSDQGAMPAVAMGYWAHVRNSVAFRQSPAQQSPAQEN